MLHPFEAYALLIMSLCSVRLKPMLISLWAYAQCLLMEAYASLNLSGGLCSHWWPMLTSFVINPWTFGLSVGLINWLMPWYLNFQFIHRSSQSLDALVHKPQFIRWSTQSTNALVLKPPVFLLRLITQTTV
jgi:hypothetical protein